MTFRRFHIFARDGTVASPHPKASVVYFQRPQPNLPRWEKKKVETDRPRQGKTRRACASETSRAQEFPAARNPPREAIAKSGQRDGPPPGPIAPAHQLFPAGVRQADLPPIEDPHSTCALRRLLLRPTTHVPNRVPICLRTLPRPRCSSA